MPIGCNQNSDCLQILCSFDEMVLKYSYRSFFLHITWASSAPGHLHRISKLAPPAAAPTVEFTCILERHGKMSGGTICYVLFQIFENTFDICDFNSLLSSSDAFDVATDTHFGHIIFII